MKQNKFITTVQNPDACYANLNIVSSYLILCGRS